ncbi:hypothetical protein M404DRAFT_33809 [Pisolithus tinctorius Marx 270]|uniref:Uncharacterized protein n=1 Tax=Pisolithus tinctorius Marx 270 TaxID=870435 RepID=A0A0C3IFS5_PISTI|nr:hypothetical protein M404DRAFT_33809 [Pisolithus tinctorius Marx 270]
MKTYTKRDELTAAANSIIKIIDRKVLGTKGLADKLRFVAWKEAVSSVVEVVDSVHKIARITHEILLTIIAAKRFCKWHERVGRENEGHPFPNWRLITHPDKATFDDHLWLQTVERRFDLQCTGFKMSAFPPAAELSSETLLKDMSRKGKEKVSDAEVKAMIGDDDGEDELADEDAEMGGDTPARWSRTPKPKLVKQEEVDELDEEDDEEEDMNMDRAVNVCDELNQLFQFRDAISAQMLEVKTRLNVFDGRRQSAMPGLFEERMRTMADDVAEVMSHQKSSEKKVHTVVRQIADEYAALLSRQTASDQRLDSAIRAIKALQLEVVALAAGQLPPADDPTSGLVAPPPPSDDGNDAMAGSGRPGDAEISGMEGDPAGAMRVTAAASTILNIRCEPPPEEYQSRSNIAGRTDGGLQPAEGMVYSYHGRADLADRPVGLEWERQSEDVDVMCRYVQGVFSDTEFPPSQ